MFSRRISAFVAALLMAASAFAETPADSPVVIVTSYNPDVKTMSDNLTAFSEVYSASDRQNPIVLENMNCLNLPESVLWKERLWTLLEKYYEDGKAPAAIILLGNEASSAYFSLTSDEIRSTPVLIGARGENIVRLPEASDTDFSMWEPESLSLSEDFPDYNIVSAYVYRYDIERNIELIRHLPSRADTLNFLTDNSFGGITMLSHMKKALSRHPEYRTRFIDGRKMEFSDVDRSIARLSPNNALIIGTWRIDKSDSYAMTNTIYALAHSNPSIPAFTVASVGLGSWAVGGYVPGYRTIGGDLATSLCDYLKTGRVHGVEIIPSSYRFDYYQTEAFKYDLGWLDDYSYLNKPKSFFEEHLAFILVALSVILILSSCLVLAMVLLRRSRQLRNELEHANRMKTDFISNISHEIRTPLNAVVGFSQMLSNPEIDIEGEEKRQFGAHIMENSRVLLDLVDDILDLSNLDLDSVHINVEQLDVAAFAGKAVEAASSNLPQGVSMRCACPASGIMADADRNLLALVLDKLLDNARKFTSEGSITVDVSNSFRDGFVLVKVTDTGCGIPKEMADYVFGRFNKLDSFKPGSGLGLAVVKSSVLAMGGRVWVDTSYEGGARICFTVPASAK